MNLIFFFVRCRNSIRLSPPFSIGCFSLRCDVRMCIHRDVNSTIHNRRVVISFKWNKNSKRNIKTTREFIIYALCSECVCAREFGRRCGDDRMAYAVWSGKWKSLKCHFRCNVWNMNAILMRARLYSYFYVIQFSRTSKPRSEIGIILCVFLHTRDMCRY